MSQPLPTAEPEHILIVDDDRATRGLLRGVLRRHGYQVSEAADGAAGVQLFAQHSPALVLLDVFMPVMDGFTACAAMRQHDQDVGTPLIILTADDDFGAIDRAFDAGATDFILKPVNWTLLTQRVRYALRTSALNREVRHHRLRQDSARRLAKLLFWEWHLGRDTLYWSDDLCAMIGREVQSVAEFCALIHADDQSRVQRTLQLVRQGATHVDIELRLQSGDDTRIVRMLGERGTQPPDQEYMFGALHDVTASRHTEALVDYLALHDELTGLGNRRLFIRQLGESIAMRQYHRTPATLLLVIFIDLTRFHRHNDAHGQSTGDLLLRHFAARLTKLVPESTGTVARVGSDEFAVLLRGVAPTDANARFETLLAHLRQPFQLDDGRAEVFLGCTAGMSRYPDDSLDAAELLALAQEAQRSARSQGRGASLAMRAHHLGACSSEALALERDLHRAVEQQEFFLVYQPQLDLRHNQIVGVEALLRWQHPERGLAAPLHFIPTLEETGLILPVGDWVLAAACQQCATWAAQGLGLRVAVNLSPRQFLEPTLFERILILLNESGAPPEKIELEITESLAMQEPTATIATLQRFRAERIPIAIDDFGIGHSSLEYLLRFPIDAIKIDRAFVMNITTTLADRAIVRAVTAMGQTLGLNIIAEGVETLRQCDFLEALGVTEVQGYLIGKPMSAAAITALLPQFVRPGSELPA